MAAPLKLAGIRVGGALSNLALFALAFALRASTFWNVFAGGQMRFPMGADEPYHMRRIWFAVVHFPATLDFDPYLNYPDGARAPWPAAFEFALAGLARLVVGAEDQLAVERFVAWGPPFLGAVTCVVVCHLGRRLFSPLAGWCAGVILALLPAHWLNSQLGLIDHHVAVTLAATLTLWAGTELLRRSQAGPILLATMCGFAIALPLALWPGSLLHVAVVQLAAITHLLWINDRSQAVSRARALAWMHVVVAMLLAPLCLGQRWDQFGSLSPLVLSDFQPLWFGAGAVCLGLLAELWQRSATGETRLRRLLGAAVAGCGGLLAAWLFIPGLRAAVTYGLGWFTKDEEFQTVVAELAPLLWSQGEFDPRSAHFSFSYLFWAFPAAWLTLAWRRGRGDDVAPYWLVLAWSGAFAVATLAQSRFGELASVGFALVIGGALEEVRREARHRLAVSAQTVLAAVVALAACIALAPAFEFHWGRVSRAMRALAGGQVEPIPVVGHARVEDAARWLRAHTPATGGYMDQDPTVRPEYGVLAPWGNGHLVRYRAERPIVQDNFGVYGGRKNYELAHEYFDAKDEEQAYAIALELRARYVLATLRGSGHDSPGPHSTGGRLWRRRGAASEPGPGEGDSRRVPALARHRLVHSVGAGAERIEVFEVVPGAQVEGRAPAGADVAFQLRLQIRAGQFEDRLWHARADSEGRYALRLPYPTQASEGPSVRALGDYRVQCGTKTAELALSDAAVSEGHAVRGPSWDQCR
jgi:dolichyl-phosphooligosaccharide-protein glycotransferase